MKLCLHTFPKWSPPRDMWQGSHPGGVCLPAVFLTLCLLFTVNTTVSTSADGPFSSFY